MKSPASNMDSGELLAKKTREPYTSLYILLAILLDILYFFHFGFSGGEGSLLLTSITALFAVWGIYTLWINVLTMRSGERTLVGGIFNMVLVIVVSTCYLVFYFDTMGWFGF